MNKTIVIIFTLLFSLCPVYALINIGSSALPIDNSIIIGNLRTNYQNRVFGTCAANSGFGAINPDGSVSCNTINVSALNLSAVNITIVESDPVWKAQRVGYYNKTQNINGSNHNITNINILRVFQPIWSPVNFNDCARLTTNSAGLMICAGMDTYALLSYVNTNLTLLTSSKVSKSGDVMSGVLVMNNSNKIRFQNKGTVSSNVTISSVCTTATCLNSNLMIDARAGIINLSASDFSLWVSGNKNLQILGGTAFYSYLNRFTFNGNISIPTQTLLVNDIVSNAGHPYLHVHSPTNITSNLAITGNLSVKRPYGMFSYNLTKTIGHINSARVLNFTFTEKAYMIKYSKNNNFTVELSGEYLVEMSMLVKSQNTNKRVQLWVRKNGVDVPRSNTIYDFKGTNQIAVIAVPFTISLLPTDSFQIYWAGDDTGISCPSVAKTTYSPEAPCMILTITKISEIT